MTYHEQSLLAPDDRSLMEEFLKKYNEDDNLIDHYIHMFPSDNFLDDYTIYSGEEYDAN